MFSITSCDYKESYNHPYCKLEVDILRYPDFGETKIDVHAIVCDWECGVSMAGVYYGNEDMEQIELAVLSKAKDIAHTFGHYLEIPDEIEVETHTVVIDENYEEDYEPNKTKVVKGVEVETKGKLIESFNIMTAEVGTTGYCGGDSGHGGRTYIKIKNEMGDFSVFSSGDADSKEVELLIGGDSELATTIECLEFILKELKGKAEQTKDKL